MGGEDPADLELFSPALQFGQARGPGASSSPASASSFDGTARCCTWRARPRRGTRSIEIDPDTGLISGEDYKVMPTPYVIDRYGAHPGWVALTFDDGPDGRWTPKILDILKQKHATATFFVIGENMQARPGLVQREVADGHDGRQPHLDPPQHRRHARSPRPTWRSTPPSACSRCSPASPCASSARPISATPSHRRRARSNRCWSPRSSAT